MGDDEGPTVATPSVPQLNVHRDGYTTPPLEHLTAGNRSRRHSPSSSENGANEPWPASLDTKRPSTNTIALPKLQESQEEEEERVDNSPSFGAIDNLAQPLTPVISRSTNQRPLTGVESKDTAQSIPARPFNSNGKISRDPMKHSIFSQAHSTVLYDEQEEDRLREFITEPFSKPSVGATVSFHSPVGSAGYLEVKVEPASIQHLVSPSTGQITGSITPGGSKIFAGSSNRIEPVITIAGPSPGTGTGFYSSTESQTLVQDNFDQQPTQLPKTTSGGYFAPPKSPSGLPSVGSLSGYVTPTGSYSSAARVNNANSSVTFGKPSREQGTGRSTTLGHQQFVEPNPNTQPMHRFANPPRKLIKEPNNSHKSGTSSTKYYSTSSPAFFEQTNNRKDPMHGNATIFHSENPPGNCKQRYEDLPRQTLEGFYVQKPMVAETVNAHRGLSETNIATAADEMQPAYASISSPPLESARGIRVESHMNAGRSNISYAKDTIPADQYNGTAPTSHHYHQGLFPHLEACRDFHYSSQAKVRCHVPTSPHRTNANHTYPQFIQTPPSANIPAAIHPCCTVTPCGNSAPAARYQQQPHNTRFCGYNHQHAPQNQLPFCNTSTSTPCGTFPHPHHNTSDMYPHSSIRQQHGGVSYAPPPYIQRPRYRLFEATSCSEVSSLSSPSTYSSSDSGYCETPRFQTRSITDKQYNEPCVTKSYKLADFPSSKNKRCRQITHIRDLFVDDSPTPSEVSLAKVSKNPVSCLSRFFAPKRHKSSRRMRKKKDWFSSPVDPQFLRCQEEVPSHGIQWGCGAMPPNSPSLYYTNFQPTDQTMCRNMQVYNSTEPVDTTLPCYRCEEVYPCPPPPPVYCQPEPERCPPNEERFIGETYEHLPRELNIKTNNLTKPIFPSGPEKLADAENITSTGGQWKTEFPTKSISSPSVKEQLGPSVPTKQSSTTTQTEMGEGAQAPANTPEDRGSSNPNQMQLPCSMFVHQAALSHHLYSPWPSHLDIDPVAPCNTTCNTPLQISSQIQCHRMSAASKVAGLTAQPDLTCLQEISNTFSSFGCSRFTNVSPAGHNAWGTNRDTKVAEDVAVTKENTQASAENTVPKEDMKTHAEKSVHKDDTQAHAENAANKENTKLPAENGVKKKKTQAPAENAANIEHTQEQAEHSAIKEETQAPAEDAVHKEDTQATVNNAVNTLKTPTSTSDDAENLEAPSAKDDIKKYAAIAAMCWNSLARDLGQYFLSPSEIDCSIVKDSQLANTVPEGIKFASKLYEAKVKRLVNTEKSKGEKGKLQKKSQNLNSQSEPPRADFSLSDNNVSTFNSDSMKRTSALSISSLSSDLVRPVPTLEAGLTETRRPRGVKSCPSLNSLGADIGIPRATSLTQQASDISVVSDAEGSDDKAGAAGKYAAIAALCFKSVAQDLETYFTHTAGQKKVPKTKAASAEETQKAPRSH